MTNARNLGTIETANPVLAVAPLKEDAEMQRATEKITALYCRLSVEDMKDDKNGGKGDVSNSIQNQKMILLQYAKEHRFPNPTFFVDDGYSAPITTAPAFRPCWPKSRQEKWPSAAPRTYPDWVEIHR